MGFSLTKTQRPTGENHLHDCAEKARTRALSERSWVVPVAEIVRRDYDLSAINPNADKAVKHRSPSAIAADIAAKEQRILEIMGEVQEILEPAKPGEEPAA